MAKTLIKGKQIQIADFIKALADVDWSSNAMAPSAKAIASKIQSDIAAIGAAMVYRGPWSGAATDTIKQGYVYVYNGNGTVDIGTGSGAKTLEPGDTLIANVDNASVTNPAHWDVVQVNITGAVTNATELNALLQGAGSVSITVSNGKVIITGAFPTISGGSAESGKYVSGFSINATTGVITVTKASLPTMPDYRNYLIRDEVMTGTVDGGNDTFYTAQKISDAKDVVVYVNGVRQHAGSGNDVVITKVASGANDGKGQVVFQSGAYIPASGDTITCDYTTASARS